MCESRESIGAAPRRKVVSCWKRAALAFVGLGVMALLVGITVVGSGWYNVGATSPHSQVVEKLLRYTMEQSVRRQASQVTIPSGIRLEDHALAERAVGHYSIACASCHAAPGEPRAPWMELYPPPPNLTESEVVGSWQDKELFWIIKNGIKDTGMIAIPPGHTDDDVWAIAAFVRQLPNMAPERYHALLEADQEGGSHAAHGHTPATATENSDPHDHSH